MSLVWFWYIPVFWEGKKKRKDEAEIERILRESHKGDGGSKREGQSEGQENVIHRGGGRKKSE